MFIFHLSYNFLFSFSAKKMQRNYIVVFNANEVKMRSMISGGRLTLVKKNLTQAERAEKLLAEEAAARAGDPHQKIAYCDLFLERVSEATPGNAAFSMTEGFKLNGDVFRAYVICDHSPAVKQAVKFTASHLQAGQALEFTVNIKCLSCLGVNLVPDVGNNVPHAPIDPIQPVGIDPLNIDDILRLASANLTETLASIRRSCSTAPDPRNELVRNKERFGHLILQAFNNAIPNVAAAQAPVPANDNRERSRGPTFISASNEHR